MNEHSVQVVISGHGEPQVQLRLQGVSSDHRVVLQVASISALPRRDPPLGTALMRPSTVAPALSLELRWSQPAPASEVPPRAEPAPVATAWAMAQRLRVRSSADPAPRRRSVRAPAG